MKTVTRMASHVHELIEIAALRPAVASVVRTLLDGITATSSVVLSEVLRPQVAKEKLRAAEQRASHALKNDDSLDELPKAYLGLVAPAARSLRFRSLDGSDLSKPASRKLEYLDVVRDGSAKPRDRVVVGPSGVRASTPRPKAEAPPARPGWPKGKRARRKLSGRKAPSPSPTARAARTQSRKEARVAVRQQAKQERLKFPGTPALKKLGYWMVAIEAGDGMGNHLPLCLDVFSTLDPAYLALGDGAWTKVFQDAMVRVLEHIGRGGTWQMDRGFDDIAWMTWMHAHVEQYNIRLKKTRRVHPGTRDAPAVQVGQFVETLATHHTTQVRYVDKSSHQEKWRPVPIAWAPIWVDGVDHPQYLVVAHTGKRRRLLLVTDVRPENAEEAGALVRAYLERWGNEETTRALKQLTGLERIRVRTLPAIRRLVWLAMIAVGVQALMILTSGRLTRAVLDRAKEFIKAVRYVIYRVWRVVQQDVLTALARRSPRLTS